MSDRAMDQAVEIDVDTIGLAILGECLAAAGIDGALLQGGRGRDAEPEAGR